MQNLEISKFKLNITKEYELNISNQEPCPSSFRQGLKTSCSMVHWHHLVGGAVVNEFPCGTNTNVHYVTILHPFEKAEAHL